MIQLVRGTQERCARRHADVTRDISKRLGDVADIIQCEFLKRNTQCEKLPLDIRYNPGKAVFLNYNNVRCYTRSNYFIINDVDVSVTLNETVMGGRATYRQQQQQAKQLEITQAKKAVHQQLPSPPQLFRPAALYPTIVSASHAVSFDIIDIEQLEICVSHAQPLYVVVDESCPLV
ncbi:hypothetical protein J6590_070771 [Homalodisca vitripennis]|nr:hypothetical protein J6590_070771 [Homalodisca vitripennis]